MKSLIATASLLFAVLFFGVPAMAQLKFDRLYYANQTVLSQWNPYKGEYQLVDGSDTSHRLNIRVTRQQIRIDDSVDRRKFVFTLQRVQVVENGYDLEPEGRGHRFAIRWLEDEEDGSQDGYYLFWYFDFDQEDGRYRRMQVTGPLYDGSYQ